MTPLEEALRRRGAELEDEVLSPGERVQLWQQIEAVQQPKGSWLWRAVGAGGLLAAAAVAFLVVRGSPEDVKVASKIDVCAMAEVDGGWTLPERCSEQTLDVGDDRFVVAPDTELERREDGVQLRHGRARFHVHPRSRGRFRVHVSRGDIAVVGTVFTVIESDGRGSVSVSEGTIVFTDDAGQQYRVAAGESLSWPDDLVLEEEVEIEEEEEEEEERVEEPATGLTPPSRRSVDIDATIQRLIQLRSQSRYDEAIRLLQRALRAPNVRGAQRTRFRRELEDLRSRVD